MLLKNNVKIVTSTSKARRCPRMIVENEGRGIAANQFEMFTVTNQNYDRKISNSFPIKLANLSNDADDGR